MYIINTILLHMLGATLTFYGPSFQQQYHYTSSITAAAHHYWEHVKQPFAEDETKLNLTVFTYLRWRSGAVLHKVMQVWPLALAGAHRWAHSTRQRTAGLSWQHLQDRRHQRDLRHASLRLT